MNKYLLLIILTCGCNNSVDDKPIDPLVKYQYGVLFKDPDGYTVKYFYSGGETHYYVTPTGSVIENKKSNDE